MSNSTYFAISKFGNQNIDTKVPYQFRFTYYTIIQRIDLLELLALDLMFWYYICMLR
jgi:hypothetical protein